MWFHCTLQEESYWWKVSKDQIRRSFISKNIRRQLLKINSFKLSLFLLLKVVKKLKFKSHLYLFYFSSNLTHSDSIGSNNSTPELPKRPPPLAPLTRSINSAFEAYEKPLSPTIRKGRNSPGLMSPQSPRIRSNSSTDPRIRKNSSGSRVIDNQSR